MFARALLAAGLGLAATAIAPAARAAGPLDSLKPGNPDIQSAGALAFGPDGILFVADSKGGAIFALDTQDRPEKSAAAPIQVEGIDAKIAGLLGANEKEVLINDLAVNPLSGLAYLSVSRGAGPDAKPVLIRVDSKGSLDEISFKGIPFAKATLTETPKEDRRQEAITDLAYLDGRVFVAGLSNEEFASSFRALPFPFAEAGKPTGVEIYHGAHGRFETAAPVRTFLSYEIQGQPHLLAAYTCTPLVKFPVSDLKAGAKVRGVTVAELGNRNRPLDMVGYEKGDKSFLLIANNNRGVMKVKCEGIAEIDGITSRINNTAGLPYDTIEALKGVEQLDKLGDGHALLLVRKDDGGLDLQAIPLP